MGVLGSISEVPVRTVFIVNRAAAGNRCGALFDSMLPRLRDGLGDFEVQTTTKAGDATRLAAIAAADGVERLVAVGGDGTMFEVVNGIMGLPNQPVLGGLPLGTGNCFLKDLGLNEPEQALQALLNGGTRAVDVVKADTVEGGFYSVNLVSMGFSALAGALTNKRFKGLGVFGYVVSVLITLGRLSHPVLPYRIDDGKDAAFNRRPVTLLSFSNSRFTGGDMMMAPNADIADGLLDVIHVGKLNRRRFLATFPKIFSGTHDADPEVFFDTAKEVSFELDGPVDIMVDGEIRTEQLLKLTVLKGALMVVA